MKILGPIKLGKIITVRPKDVRKLTKKLGGKK